MNNRRYILCLIGLLLPLSVGFGQTPAPAQPKTDASSSSSDNSVVELPEFTVSTSRVDAYRPSDTISAARIRGQLIDTPASIKVVTRALLDDVSANSMYDVTRYFGGISNGRGAGIAGGINDRQNFRGFESFTRTIDNFSGTYIPGNSTSIDAFESEFIERVEVVMGPDAILSPTGSPGGSINIITKSPQFTPENHFTAVLGNYNAQKFTLDSTGPLPFGGGKFAYRFVGNYQDAKTYVPGRFRKINGMVELTYKPSDTSEITAKYFYVQYAAVGAASAPNDNGWLVTDPSSIGGATIADKPAANSGFTYGGYNGVTPWSITSQRVNTAELVYTGTIFDKISMRLGGALFTQYNIGDSAYPSSAPSEIFDNATGQVIGITAFDPTNVPIVARYNRNRDFMWEVQNDYAANFHPGSVSLQAVAGWTFQHNLHYPTTTKQATLPPANLLSGVLYDAPRPDFNTDYVFSARNKGSARQSQAYALVKTGFFDDRATLSGGVSRTWVKSDQYTYNPSNLSAPPTLASLDGTKDNYMGSFVYKPRENVSVYYTYSTNAALVSSAGKPLWQEGKQHEFGIKSEFFQRRLSITAAHFQIAQTNLTTPNPAYNVDPLHNSPNTLSDQTNRGYELDVVGGLTRNISVVASVTTMKYRDTFGRRARNVPDDMANLLVNYHFTDGRLKGFAVYGGVQYNGKTAGENPPNSLTPSGVPKQVGFYVAPWTVFNAGASYRFDRYRFNLSIDNVLNSKFVWQPASRLSVSPYPGTTIRLTTDIQF